MLLLIALLPFLGFLVNASIGRRLSKALSGAVACAAILASFLIAVVAVFRLLGLEPDGRLPRQRRSTGGADPGVRQPPIRA